MAVRIAVEPRRFSDVYRLLGRRLRESGVGEALQLAYSGPVGRAGERLVQSIWFDQYLRTDALRTQDGRSLEVLSPGWWNVEPGPDFLAAELRFGGGEVVRADVEVHVAAEDWYRHGHDTDPAYAGVGLHVVLDEARGHVFVSHREGARRIPQLVVSRFLSEELADIAEVASPASRTSDSAGPGPCREAWRGAGEEWMGRFLDAAGDERILRKAEVFAGELEQRTPDDALFEGVMDALGYKSNRRPFRRLMRRLPVAELRRFIPPDAPIEERTLRAEAMFFGVAGLLPEGEPEWDEATARYVADLHRAWAGVARELEGRAMRRADWTFGGVRPLNRPERRIAAAAHFVAAALHSGLFRTLAQALEVARGRPSDRARAAGWLKGIESLLAGEATGYWARRCTFGGRALARVHRLVGRERAAAILINIGVPLVLCEARRGGDESLEALVHGLYAAMRPLSENRPTRRVQGRLFASPDEARRVVTSARRQQGLLQVYADFCHAATETCERCLLRLAALAEEGAEPC